MVTVVRWISACLSSLPNTFFEVLPLLLPMAEGWEVRGGSVQELVPMIVRPDLIENVENDQRSNDRQDQPGRMKESTVTGS